MQISSVDSDVNRHLDKKLDSHTAIKSKSNRVDSHMDKQVGSQLAKSEDIHTDKHIVKPKSNQGDGHVDIGVIHKDSSKHKTTADKSTDLGKLSTSENSSKKTKIVQQTNKITDQDANKSKTKTTLSRNAKKTANKQRALLQNIETDQSIDDKTDGIERFTGLHVDRRADSSEEKLGIQYLQGTTRNGITSLGISAATIITQGIRRVFSMEVRKRLNT